MNCRIAVLALLAAMSGCSSRALLPEVPQAEQNRAWQSIPAVDDQTFRTYIKQSYYRLWLSQYGAVTPPTVAPGTKLDPESLAAAESSVSALEVIQLIPLQLHAMRDEFEARELELLIAEVERYRAPIIRRVERVGAMVANAAGRSDLSFEIMPIGLNAAVPKEFGVATVWVGSELALLLESDDELAAVLGHEVAHIVEGHAAKGAAWDLAISALQVAVATAIIAADQSPDAGTTAGALGAAYLTGALAHGALTVSGYERDQEREADLIGLTYAVRAGFDPVGGLAAFQKLAMIEKGRGGDQSIPFLRDHPGTDERLVRVTRVAGRLRGENFNHAGLFCWTVPFDGQHCQSCCTSTSFCVSECQ